MLKVVPTAINYCFSFINCHKSTTFECNASHFSRSILNATPCLLLFQASVAAKHPHSQQLPVLSVRLMRILTVRILLPIKNVSKWIFPNGILISIYGARMPIPHMSRLSITTVLVLTYVSLSTKNVTIYVQVSTSHLQTNVFPNDIVRLCLCSTDNGACFYNSHCRNKELFSLNFQFCSITKRCKE